MNCFLIFRHKPISSANLSLFIKDSQRVFLIAICTSWLTTTTVWVNNFTSKSKFLITSSIASCLSHMLCIGCIYIQIFYGTSIVFDNAPLTHCFPMSDGHVDIISVTPYVSGVLVHVKDCKSETTRSTKIIRYSLVCFIVSIEFSTLSSIDTNNPYLYANSPLYVICSFL